MNRFLGRVLLVLLVQGAATFSNLTAAEHRIDEASSEPLAVYAPAKGWMIVDSIAFSGDDDRLCSLVREHKFWERAFNNYDDVTLKAFDPCDGTEKEKTYSEERGACQLLHVAFATSHPLFGPDEVLMLRGVPSGYRFKAGKKQIVLTKGLSGKELASFSYQSDGMSVQSLALSPTEPILAFASCWLHNDEDPGFFERSRVELLSLPSGRQLFEFTDPTQAYGLSVAFSPDGKLFAAAGGHEVGGTLTPNSLVPYISKYRSRLYLWETATGELVRESDFEFDARSIAFSPDGKTIAIGGDVGVHGDGANLAWWNVSTGKLVGEIDFGPSKGKLVPAVKTIAYSPDGRFLAAGIGREGRGGGWGEVRLVENASMQIRHDLLKGDDASVPSVIFSHDGKWIAARTRHNEVFLWDVAKLAEE